MKRTYIPILVLGIAGLFSSCETWLEATSETQIPADKLFESREGFQDALSGIYINMGSRNLYASFTTWFGLDEMVFPYSEASNSTLRLNIQRHNYNYSSVKALNEACWQKYYNVIANINLALRNLENKPEVFTCIQEYNLFKGELLALRALLHFDLMCIYGTDSWEGENADKLAIPYVTQYTSEVTGQVSYARTEALLFADLNAAIEALGQSDPVLLQGEEAARFEESCNMDGYWNNRTKHMNYYATLALAARIYQWKNDLTTAASYARQVIDGALGKIVDWVDVENLLTAASDDARDWTFSTEQLFSLEVTGLYDITMSDLFDITGIHYGMSIANSTVDNYLYVRFNPETGSTAGAEDVRGPALQLRIGARGYYCYKLYGSSSYHAGYRNRIPIIRISEMYYILAENYIAQGNNRQALEMLDRVRTRRGIADEFPATTDAGTELLLEYYREFLCEGRLFFFLKHKQIEQSPIPGFTVNRADLVLPYPDDEINYGHIQEL